MGDRSPNQLLTKVIANTPNANSSLNNPNLHFATKFQPNQTKIANASYRGGFWVGGWGGWSGLNMVSGTPNFILLLVILIYTSPQIFIKIGPKLTKLSLEVVFGVVGRVVGVV